jgi:hypothetical protein
VGTCCYHALGIPSCVHATNVPAGGTGLC